MTPDEIAALLDQCERDLERARIAYRDAETATREIGEWGEEHFGHVEFARVEYMRAKRRAAQVRERIGR